MRNSHKESRVVWQKHTGKPGMPLGPATPMGPGAPYTRRRYRISAPKPVAPINCDRQVCRLQAAEGAHASRTAASLRRGPHVVQHVW